MDGLLEAVGVPVWVVEADHGAANGYPSVPGLIPAARVIAANPAALTLHGAGNLGQLLGRLDQVFPSEGRTALGDAWAQLAGGAPRALADTVLATLSGRRLVARINLVRLDSGRVVWTVSERTELGDAVGIDVYRRLAESEARFRTMADYAPVMLWMTGTSARCEFFNRGWLEFTGRTIEQEIGPGWAEGVHPQDFQRCMEIFLDNFVIRKAFSMEYRLMRHDGVYRWILDQGLPRFGPDGTFAGFIGSCIDITPLKELQHELDGRIQELGLRLREREVLLQEVHHRVKNNLQLVSSLLRMQAREVRDTATAAVLEDCQNRVHSIAAIHDGLYLSDDFSRVALGGYARSLVSRIIQATGASPSVAVDVRVTDVDISVDRAIPCGLLINELVTNAIKHAFPAGRAGTVRVEVHALAPGDIELVVADDGVGIPDHLGPGVGASLGLRLVSILVEQLDATIDVDCSAGTRVAIRFRSVT